MRRLIAALTLLSLVADIVRMETALDDPTTGRLHRRRRADRRHRAPGHRHPAVGDAGLRVDRGARGTPATAGCTGCRSGPRTATAVSPEQLLFFDHNSPLGTPDAKSQAPHDRAVVSVTMRCGFSTWQVAGDSVCCPTGVGTVQYQIGPSGKFVTRGPVPNR